MSPPRTSKDEAVDLLKQYREDILKQEIARVEGRLEKHEDKTENKFKETDDILGDYLTRFHGIDRRQDDVVRSVKEVHEGVTAIRAEIKRGHVNGRVMTFFVITTLLTAAGLVVAILK